jgi:arsenite methyltransferase
VVYSCIDGSLTKENYLESIRKAGFNNISVLQGTSYLEDNTDGRRITSVVIRAVK